MSKTLAEHLEQACPSFDSFASSTSSAVLTGDAGADAAAFDGDIVCVYQVKSLSDATDLDLRRIAAVFDRTRLRLERDFGNALGPISLFIASQDLATLSGSWSLAGSLVDPSELASLVRGLEPVPGGPAEERPRSAVIAEACRALRCATASAPLDVLARTHIGVSPASMGTCRVIRRFAVAELCQRLQELAQFVRAIW